MSHLRRIPARDKLQQAPDLPAWGLGPRPRGQASYSLRDWIPAFAGMTLAGYALGDNPDFLFYIQLSNFQFQGAAFCDRIQNLQCRQRRFHDFAEWDRHVPVKFDHVYKPV